MTSRFDTTTRHQTTFRRDDHLQHIELRLAEVEEHHRLLRSIRDGDRFAEGRSRSIRRRIGESLVRLGRRIGGDAVSAPAWQA